MDTDNDQANLLQRLKDAYQGLQGARDRQAIANVVEPLLVGLNEDDRTALGEQLWGEFYTSMGQVRKESHRVYPFTGLAGYFYIPNRGS